MPPALRVTLKALAFAVLLGLALLAVKTQDGPANVSPVGYKLAALDRLQPETVFIGSSQTYRHVNAALFDSLRGGTSYNLGLEGASALEVHYLAERLLEEAPYVQRLVVELRTVLPAELGAENRRTRRTYYHHDFRRARLGARAALASKRPLPERLRLAAERYAVALGRYALLGQGGDLFEGPVQPYAPLPPLDRQGYLALEDEAALAAHYRATLRPAKLAEVDERIARVRARHRAFGSERMQARFARGVARLSGRERVEPSRLDAFVADVWVALHRRAEARGVALYFVEQVGQPHTMGVARLLGERLPPGQLLVLNDPNRYPSLVASTFWFDKGHLSKRGAREVTGLLAELLPPGPTP